MPPKHIKKNTPLTSLERRAKKKKQELIHKARVKSEYYKTLEKEHTDNTPDYVKDYEFRSNKRSLDKDANDAENKDNLQKIKKQKKDDDTTKSFKPNPFKKQLDEQEKKRKLSQKQREERDKEFENKKKATKKYYHDRNKTRGKMLAKHKNGQPNLNTQLNVLIGRLKKD
ncbi:unnamed protein product [Cunninghamella blakesleeana]